MDDEQAPIEETPDAVEETVDVDEQPSVDYEQRYNDLRPQFDRHNQELAQYRQLVEGLSSDDPHTRQAAAEALNIEFVDTDGDEDEYEDPIVQRLAAIDRRLTAREERERKTEEDRFLNEATHKVESQLEALDVEPEFRDWILTKALSMEKTPDGLPDIKAAHVQFNRMVNAMQKSWVKTKKGSPVSPVGTSGTQVPNLDDPTERLAWMVSQAEGSGA